MQLFVITLAVLSLLSYLVVSASMVSAMRKKLALEKDTSIRLRTVLIIGIVCFVIPSIILVICFFSIFLGIKPDNKDFIWCSIIMLVFGLSHYLNIRQLKESIRRQECDLQLPNS